MVKIQIFCQKENILQKNPKNEQKIQSILYKRSKLIWPILRQSVSSGPGWLCICHVVRPGWQGDRPVTWGTGLVHARQALYQQICIIRSLNTRGCVLILKQGFSVQPWLILNSISKAGWPQTQLYTCLCFLSGD